ncbi:hypothetical protein T07_12227 [Trichinella nelsoni]|uniref:Uncharacterized protein n=1 Tax=Trichinella nelsoni TaxID=6336 RepID=A0A0V0RW91_9BILA|nr:hypothetical protein T07_12227 [Trichinella nelsoni]
MVKLVNMDGNKFTWEQLISRGILYEFEKLAFRLNFYNLFKKYPNKILISRRDLNFEILKVTFE